ncbi:hypothetical protein KJA17_02425 [Patescibacteria group bacterium]|nr:hypothetical protein [Patescibacteria group bacterium]
MIIGHKTQWEFLERIAKTQRVPQAMLFSGQNSLGKQRVALEFVKLLNCETPLQNFKGGQKRPCGECFSCKNIEKERYPDLSIVRPQKREIQISQIRALQNTLNLGSQISSTKSVIIETAEALNTPAQNCLLKTLEEPKGKTLLILISSQPEMLLPTIISRTQILKFYPLSSSEMEEHFKGKAPQVFLEKLIFLSAGLPGKAIDFLKDPEKLNSEIRRYQLIQKILDSKLSQRFSYLKKLFPEEDFAVNLGSFLEILIRYLRQALLKKLQVGKNYPKSFIGFSKSLQNYHPIKLKKMIEISENLRFLISQTNINPKLALENLMLYL